MLASWTCSTARTTYALPDPLPHTNGAGPFHKWVEDEAAKLLRARLQLPVAETLHIAHVLAQTVVGF